MKETVTSVHQLEEALKINGLIPFDEKLAVGKSLLRLFLLPDRLLLSYRFLLLSKYEFNTCHLKRLG